MEKKKIKLEVAVGVILVVALLAGVAIYRAGSFSVIVGMLPQVKKKTPQAQDNLILFATNGKKEIYKKQVEDSKWVVIIDGQESAAYDYVATPTFSLDGEQFAFSAYLGGEAFVVVDNVAQDGRYVAINQIVFSPDGKSIAYVANKGNTSVVVLNGDESKEYNGIGSLQTPEGNFLVLFSPDGQKVAYKVVEEDGVFIVINNEEGKKYFDIISVSYNENGELTYQAQLGDQLITVVGNEQVSSVPIASGDPTPPPTNGTNNGTTGSTTTTKKKNYRTGRDVYLDPDRLTYPTCTGNGCNF